MSQQLLSLLTSKLRNLEEVFDMSGLKIDIYRVAQLPDDPKLNPIKERYIALVSGHSGKDWFRSETLFGLHSQMQTNSVVITDWHDVENKIATEGVFRLER
jgi:hypothetical protein